MRLVRVVAPGTNLEPRYRERGVTGRVGGIWLSPPPVCSFVLPLVVESAWVTKADVGRVVSGSTPP